MSNNKLFYNLYKVTLQTSLKATQIAAVYTSVNKMMDVVSKSKEASGSAQYNNEKKEGKIDFNIKNHVDLMVDQENLINSVDKMKSIAFNKFIWFESLYCTNPYEDAYIKTVECESNVLNSDYLLMTPLYDDVDNLIMALFTPICVSNISHLNWFSYNSSKFIDKLKELSELNDFLEKYENYTKNKFNVNDLINKNFISVSQFISFLNHEINNISKIGLTSKHAESYLKKLFDELLSIKLNVDDKIMELKNKMDEDRVGYLRVKEARELMMLRKIVETVKKVSSINDYDLLDEIIIPRRRSVFESNKPQI